MPNIYRCEQTLEVGEEKYSLRFDWNSAAEYETVARETISEALLAIASGKLSAVTLRAMLWSGLRANHREITLEQAGELIGRAGRVTVVRVVSAALRYYFPDAVSGGEKPSDPQTPPA